MAAPSFRWATPPSAQLIPALGTYDERIKAGIAQIADLFAAKLESEAKAGAPWSDRSGAARQGLRGFATKEATRVVLTLAHGVFYGQFLETGTSRMAPRPIIMPTLQANYAPIMAAVRQLVGA